MSMIHLFTEIQGGQFSRKEAFNVTVTVEDIPLGQPWCCSVCSYILRNAHFSGDFQARKPGKVKRERKALR